MHAGAVRRRQDPEDRSVRRTWRLLSGAFLLLGAITGVRALTSNDALDWVPLAAVAIGLLAAIAHRNAVVGLEARGRSEAENFARILRGLSRSVSGEAIVGAIVDDLADGTGADHVVVVRRRPEGRAFEATLVTHRAGVPNSSTILPFGDLTTMSGPGSGVPVEPVAIPIHADGDRVAAAVAGAPPVATSPSSGATPGPTPMRTITAIHEPAPDTALRRSRAAAGRLGSLAMELLVDFGVPIARPGTGALLAARAEVIGEGMSAAIAGRIAERVHAVYGLSHTLAAPLQAEGEVIGAIVLSRRDREPWTEPARRLLDGAAVEAAAALARAYTYREATAHAATDPLTGLPNRRYFDEFCGLLARRRRSGDAVAVLMVDIDKFKVLNDTYGHAVGDEVLKAVAGAIVTAVREEDVPARVGGEEFAVLLRNPGPDVAIEVGERVREAVRALDLREFHVPGVSVSVGVANARGADEPIPTIVDRADQALFRAKRAGRDRVIAA